MSNQFGRRAELLLGDEREVVDLSALHFKFKVKQFDTGTPNSAEIRVYNVSEQTEHRFVGNQHRVEYRTVSLKAGYEGNGAYGLIFSGTVRQFRRGRERNVDSYIDLLCSDNDLGYNFGVVNQSFAAGTTVADQVEACAKAMGIDPRNIHPNFRTGLFMNQAPRGRVMYGLARAYLDDFVRTAGGRWFRDRDGLLNFVSDSGYLPGEVVELNSRTGMVGQPIATDNGIEVRCLLNSNIHVGGRVRINNRDVNATIVANVPQTVGFPALDAFSFPARVADDGLYRVIVHDYVGDTRGGPWYSQLICLDVDDSAPPEESVSSFNQPNLRTR